MPEQSSHAVQPMHLVLDGEGVCRVDFLRGIGLQQGEQAEEHLWRGGLAERRDVASPFPGVRPDSLLDLGKRIGLAISRSLALLRRDMPGDGVRLAPRDDRMDAQGRLCVPEDGYSPSVRAHPNLLPQFSRRDGVVCIVDLDMPVVVDHAKHFPEAGKQHRGSGCSAGFSSPNIAMTCRFMVPWILVSAILRIQFLRNSFSSAMLSKHRPFTAFPWTWPTAALSPSLVPGHPHMARHETGSVVVGEGLYLRVQHGIVPVGRRHGGLQVIQADLLRHAAEEAECVLDAAYEAFRVLTRHGLRIHPAAICENAGQHRHTAPASVNDDRGAESVVHLHLLARLN